MSPKLGYPASAHREEGSSPGTPATTKPAREGPEIRKELPLVYRYLRPRISLKPKVRKELPQIDHSMAWKMFVDKAKNSLGAGAGIVLKSTEGSVF